LLRSSAHIAIELAGVLNALGTCSSGARPSSADGHHRTWNMWGLGYTSSS
jgi:hypothetical protein